MATFIYAAIGAITRWALTAGRFITPAVAPFITRLSVYLGSRASIANFGAALAKYPGTANSPGMNAVVGKIGEKLIALNAHSVAASKNLVLGRPVYVKGVIRPTDEMVALDLAVKNLQALTDPSQRALKIAEILGMLGQSGMQESFVKIMGANKTVGFNIVTAIWEISALATIGSMMFAADDDEPSVEEGCSNFATIMAANIETLRAIDSVQPTTPEEQAAFEAMIASFDSLVDDVCSAQHRALSNVEVFAPEVGGDAESEKFIRGRVMANLRRFTGGDAESIRFLKTVQAGLRLAQRGSLDLG